MTQHRFFATSPRHLEPLLADELTALGAESVKVGRSGVHFSGTLAKAYRVCLWSRLANRVLLQLTSFAAHSPEALYRGVQTIDWANHIHAQGTLAVRARVHQSKVNHSHYAALKVKDAIVDQLRDRFGSRPSVDTDRPDVRVSLQIYRNQAELGIDLSGQSLHRRGWRAESGGEAPLKENLAAAILIRGGWPELAAAGAPLVDPLCGTGTFLIEGACIAADIAPGLDRDYFGFLGWRGHQPEAWRVLLDDAHARKEAGLEQLPPILGSDISKRALERSRVHVRRAGFEDHIELALRDVRDLQPPEGASTGLVACNPPYGERVGRREDALALHQALGTVLAERFLGWKAVVITGDKELGFAIPLRARKRYSVFNGKLPCSLLCFDVEPDRVYTPRNTSASSTQGQGDDG